MPDPYAGLYGGAQAPQSDPYASLYGAPKAVAKPSVTPAPTAHGAGGSWGDPSLLDQVKAGAGQAADAVRHLPSTVAGMGKSALHDLDVVGRLVSAGEGGPSEGVEKLSGGDMARAGVNTAANFLLPYAGVLGVLPRVAVSGTLGALNDKDEPIRGATAGVLTGELLHAGTKALPRLPGRRGVAEHTEPTVQPPAATDADLAAADPQERNVGLSLGKKARTTVRNTYRSALVTPYAAIEEQAPELADALMAAGSANARAEHISTTRMNRVVGGLSDTQRAQFGSQLLYDNLIAEAERKGSSANDLLQQAAAHVADLKETEAVRRQLAPQVEQSQQAVDAMAAQLQQLRRASGPEPFAPRSTGAKLSAADQAAVSGNVQAADALEERLNAARAATQHDANVVKQLDAHRAEIETRIGDLQSQHADVQTAVQNFSGHAANLAPRLLPGIQNEPWFQKALGQYKTDIEGPLTQDAIASGVNPASLRQPASAYVRLASEARLNDAEMRRALDVAGVTDPSQLQQRPALLRKLIGENPALKRYFARNAPGPRQGPLAANAGYPGEPAPFGGKRVGITGSSNMAQGTAENYVSDLPRIVDFDARDKAVKASKNRIWQEVANVGRPLEEGEAPAPGMKVLAFDDKKGLVNGDVGTQRYEVTPDVHEAVNRFYASAAPPSTAAKTFRKFNDFATRAQIAGMPVEAMSHANTLTSLVGKVPGEQDMVGRALATIPGIGNRLASVREMAALDFSDPATQALENRLSDIGALRSTVNHEGLINSSHNWLFGDPTTPGKVPGLNKLQGVDTRARLVLARKYLDRAPDASDADLREFITSQVGNYNAQNAGALPNFMAKGSFLSPFARFQSARIPTAIKRTVGISDLPTTSAAGRLGDVANTLYRGPLGYAIAGGVANYALSGHSTQQNEPGRALDVNTGLYAVPGGIKRMTAQAAQAQYGDKASPLYLPAATLDPVTYAGLRATGLRALVPPFSPEQPGESRGGNAVRDVVNVALGTAGPMMRGLQTAFTGTQPYLQPDGTFLRVTPHRFGATSELAGNVAAALGMANPALHAFTTNGGDASRTLASALAKDGEFMGGPASIAAKVGEFTFPRLLQPSMGGRTNEQSMLAQMDRRYREAVLDYSNRIKRAAGPVAQRAIIEEARRDAVANGFDPDAVVVALEKVQAQDRDAVAARSEHGMQRRIQKELTARPP